MPLVTPSLCRVCAAVSPPAAGAAEISLTDALLLLCFGGLLWAGYELHQVLHRLAVLEKRLKPARAGSGSAVAPAGVRRGTANATLPPEQIAAIVAACEVVLECPARVVAISSATDDWPGRMQVS